MHVPIVGAGGFIGRHLAGRLMADGMRVTAAGRSSARPSISSPFPTDGDQAGDRVVTPSLFRRLLGLGFDALPLPLRSAHDGGEDQCWSGLAEVETSHNPLARLLCRTMRLPAPGSAVPVTVVFERRGDGERWTRTFADRRYASTLSARDAVLVERIGPAVIVFRLRVEGGALHLDLVGFRFLGVPVPAPLRPRCHACEREEGGRYVFDVPVDLPGLGRVLRYTGHLERQSD